MTLSKLYSVDDLDLSFIKTNPPRLICSASGRAPSSGWSGPTLTPYSYVDPPADGIQEFDFVAQPPAPDSFSFPALSPAHTDFDMGPVDVQNHWGQRLPLVGVRVYAAENHKSALLQPPAEMKAPVEYELSASGTVASARDNAGVSFAADIRPKFRFVPDVISMQSRGLDLHDYESVKDNAATILERLERGAGEQGAMPCDGPWPDADIALFRSWIDAGHPV